MADSRVQKAIVWLNVLKKRKGLLQMLYEGRDEAISCTTLMRIKEATIWLASSNFELNPPRSRETWMHPSSFAWRAFLMSRGLGENENSFVKILKDRSQG